MRTRQEVEAMVAQLTAAGTPKDEIIRQVADACLGWPYVFGAWGEPCTPANRRKRARDDHPTIVSKCPALNGRSCSECQWGIGVRQYDCRGFTRWLLQQVGLDIAGAGATSQYNKAENWEKRGPISEMPDVVCCVFKDKNGTKEHTGMHVGGGKIIHCSNGVQTGKITAKGWTHYAIPKGLYGEAGGAQETPEAPAEPQAPVTPAPARETPTLRQGYSGDAVRHMQTILNGQSYDCGAVDGRFGARTKAALIRWQTDARLSPDGICGPKTWATLLAAEKGERPAPAPVEKPVTYRVMASGVTYEQYRRILEICPLAECYEEG